MSYREKTIFISLISAVLVFGVYVLCLSHLYADGRFEGAEAASLVGQSVLVLIAASIVVNIVVTITFNIVFAIATNDPKPSFVVDERDKLIELKGMQIFFVTFSVGFVGSMIVLAMGTAPFVVFGLIIFSMFAGSAVGDVTKLFFYRRGF